MRLMEGLMGDKKDRLDYDAVYGMLRGDPALRLIRFRAQGGSMMPVIERGDIVTVVPADAGNLRVGDVVLYQSGSIAVVHRMLMQYSRGGSTWLLTKGDAMPEADSPVEAGRLIGRVVSIERGGRRLDLDRPAMRAISVLIAMISPVSRYYLPVARRIKRLLERFGVIGR
jgi:signal peptidase I